MTKLRVLLFVQKQSNMYMGKRIQIIFVTLQKKLIPKLIVEHTEIADLSQLIKEQDTFYKSLYYIFI